MFSKGDENIYFEFAEETLCRPKRRLPGQLVCATCECSELRRCACEFEVAQGRRIHMYASRTLIQDCTSKSREERRWGEKVDGAVLSRRGFPRKLGRSGSLPRIPPSRAKEVEATPPPRRAAATLGIHSVADVGRHLGIDIR